MASKQVGTIDKMDYPQNGDKPNKVIYCDQLTLMVWIRLLWMRFGGLFGNQADNVQVLDPVPGTVWNRTLRATMKLLGVNVEEAHFSAGRLRADNGQAVAIVSGRWAEKTTLLAADKTIANSRFLSGLNDSWGGDTIRLHLARQLWNSVVNAGSRLLVASALARDAGAEGAVALVTRPHDFDPIYLTGLCSNLDVRFHGSGFSLIRTVRLYLILWLFRSYITELKWRTVALGQRLSGRNKAAGLECDGSASIFLIQESEVSFDRSYRTQPHWVFKNEGDLPFTIYILETEGTKPPENGRLMDKGIQMVSEKQIALMRNGGPALPVQKLLTKDLRRCISQSLLGWPGPQIAAATRLSRLFFTATRMANFCQQANVKAFMTSENYYVQADALHLIAPQLGIHTFTYQVSNQGQTSPVLLTNSDTMFTFSSLYHDLWITDGIRPGSFVDVGYVYESSFPLVRERSRMYRSRLQEAGAEFIICYFDENSMVGKYGPINSAEHVHDLLALMRLVLDDPSVGLVLKTKQLATSPRYLEDDEISEVLKSVVATGRYAELMYGTRRNIVFPAEAALCADLTIGHSLGSTAVLEGALAGTCGILLNPCEFTGASDALYAKADIIYPSLPEALEAIRAFRAGDPERQNLGDWSAIIDEFDPFRDGQPATEYAVYWKKL